MALIWPRAFFESRRRSFAALPGFVLRRFFGRCAASCISATSLARAASRFMAWVRCSRLSISSTPSLVMRLPASAISRSFMSYGSAEARTSNRSSTAVETLSTFCPPGPDARTNRSSSSRSSIEIVSVIRIMELPSPLDCRECQAGPADQEQETADRRDRAEDGDTGQCEDVQTAGEEHDAADEAPAGHADQPPAEMAQDPRDEDQRQRVVHVVLDAGLEHRHHLGGQTRAQPMRAERAERHREERRDRTQQQEGFVHREPF